MSADKWILLFAIVYLIFYFSLRGYQRQYFIAEVPTPYTRGSSFPNSSIPNM